MSGHEESSDGVVTYYEAIAPPPGTPQWSTLTVVIPGFTVSGTLTVEANVQGEPSLLTQLRQRGHVIVVNHSKGFTYAREASCIVRRIGYNIDRLVLLCHSMGGRVGTAVIDEVRRQGMGHLVEGTNGLMIAAHAPWDEWDLIQRGQLHWMQYLWHWPRVLNIPLSWLFDKAMGPKYTIEPGNELLVKRNRRYRALRPNHDKIEQIRAMLGASQVPDGRYAGVQLACFEAGIDNLVHPTFVAKYYMAFGGGVSRKCNGCAHGSWIEQPSKWLPIITGTLDGHGFLPY